MIMKDFFDTIYYYTNGFYSELLDTYLYETVPGYLHIGIFLVVFSLIICVIFYYGLAPVRKQTLLWFVYVGINVLLNIGVSLYYTMTPLINNEIDVEAEWNYLDCFGFCLANSIWAIVFFVVISLIIKWGSVAKYVPFQKF